MFARFTPDVSGFVDWLNSIGLGRSLYLGIPELANEGGSRIGMSVRDIIDHFFGTGEVGRYCYENEVQQLCAFGVPPFSKDGNCFLCHAAMRGNIANMRDLLHWYLPCGTIAQANLDSALGVAVAVRKLDAVKFLVEHGADPLSVREMLVWDLSRPGAELQPIIEYLVGHMKRPSGGEV